MVGTVFRKHGIRGEVKVYPLTDSPQRFLDLRDVLLEDTSGRRHPVRIDRVRFQQDRLILHFEDKDRIEDIEPFLQSKILIHRSAAVPLEPGRYYFADILGLDVYTDRGRYLGKVEDILQTGSNDVYVVRAGGKEVLIPAIKDVVHDVDLDKGRLTVHEMEGLIE